MQIKHSFYIFFCYFVIPALNWLNFMLFIFVLIVSYCFNLILKLNENIKIKNDLRTLNDRKWHFKTLKRERERERFWRVINGCYYYFKYYFTLYIFVWYIKFSIWNNQYSISNTTIRYSNKSFFFVIDFIILYLSLMATYLIWFMSMFFADLILEDKLHWNNITLLISSSLSKYK